MLLAAKKQDSEAFYEKLKIARKEQVVPLSAASFECGTYSIREDMSTLSGNLVVDHFGKNKNYT